MIAFVVSGDHQYTIRGALARRHRLHGRVLILSYRDFLQFPQLPHANYIFADLERLDPALIRATEARLARLREAAPEIEVLNPPQTGFDRLLVMSRLHRRGINAFRVLPGSETPEDLHFPVFLRRLDNHDGPATALLNDAGALVAARSALLAAGIPPERMALTEYVDARNALGLHEKRSYFRIGERFFPAGLDASRNWVCKGAADDPDSVPMADEIAFLSGQEDEPAIRAAFDAAEIGYGRADYALVNGRPQIFEINTNPMVETPEKLPRAMRDYSRIVLRNWLDALATFAGEAKAVPEWVELGRTAVPGDTAGDPPVRGVLRHGLLALNRLHHETRFLRPLRLLGSLQ